MKYQFSLMLLWFLLPASLFAQFQGSIDNISESVCQANGSVTVSGPASNLYALTGVSIPQLGPFSPPATFTDLPAGNYTVTEFTLDNQEHSQAVTVPGNYEQNWIFTAEVDYDPCSNGTPSVSINNFTIINADPGEQRPPYLFRISSKNGSLPGDGSEPPAFTSATSFPIDFPSGMNGNYELQARDACGNYKTINVYVPLTAPGPSVGSAFNGYANCDGLPIATQVTHSGGYYHFANLAAGNYIVSVANANFGSGQLLENLLSTTGNDPAPDPDNDVDNDDNGTSVSGFGVASQAITLGGTEPNLPTDENGTNGNTTVDFGFYCSNTLSFRALVSSHTNDKVIQYDYPNGNYTADFVTSGLGGLSRPYGMTYGSNGNLFVSNSFGDGIIRYNGQTGALIGTFVSSGSGGLDDARGLTFGPDGNLYVNSYNTDEVKRYNGTTGAFIDNFVPNTAGLNGPHTSLLFGPDGYLYVACLDNDKVMRFDGQTGVFNAEYNFSGYPNLADVEKGPRGLTFGPDGDLYVGARDNNIYKIDLPGGTTSIWTTGVSELYSGIGFGPDGDLYAVAVSGDLVRKFDYPSGANLGRFDNGGTLGEPKAIVFLPNCSQACTITVDSATPTACNPATNTYSLDVAVTYSTQPTGDITINVGGTDYTFTPDGTSPDTYTVTGLASNGTVGIDVTATFVGDAACTDDLVDAYDAPASCTPPFVACGDIPVIWLVDEDQAAPSMHLWSFKDYNDATNTGTDYGRVTYIDPSTGDTTAFATSSAHGDLESMAVNQSTGQAYFLTASKISGGPSGGQTLFTYNLNDAAANKGKIALTVIGHIQRPNNHAAEVLAFYNNRLYLADPVTSGQNSDASTDILMYVDLGALNANVMLNTIPTIVGPIQGLGQTNNYVDGMEILPDGTLYTVDGTDDHLYRVSLATAVILEVVDNNIPGGIDPDADVETIAWDPVNNKLIGADNELQQFVNLTLDGTNGNNVVTSFYIGTPGIFSLVDFEGSAMFVMCCDLTVNSAVPSICDINGQYTLSVDVTYTNVSGDIMINGQAFTPSGVTGRDTFVLTLLTANGAIDVDVTAQSVTEVTCSSTLVDAYDAPANCACNLSASADGTPVSCNSGNNGTATATATGNLVPVTYLWSNGATTASITGLTAGTYTVTVTETPTCTAVASYTVTEPTLLDAACTKTDATTIGGNQGTASVIATGGTAPYTYLWSNGQTTTSISGLTAGTYGVTVTDLNGCTANCVVTVQEPGCNLSATATGTDVSCNGGNNGTATATATGNLVPITYLWSNGSTTASITGLTAGTYTVTVTETPTCTAVASYTVTEPTLLDAACTKTDATTIGGSEGTATVTATGGTAPYTYLWSNGQTSASITGLTAGTYTVTVTDLNGCTANCMVTVQEPGCNLSANATGTDVSCNGGNNGTATATATGNLVPVTYLWSNGSTTASITGLIAGTYTVTVTETPTCTAVASYTVTEPTLLDAACTKTDATTIGGADGTASVIATGGTAPYTYLWSNGQTTASISGLTADTYGVTVTDLNGCTANCMVTVQEPGCNLSANATGTDVSCNAGTDGTAAATATGNLVPVTYLWSNGETTASITGLVTGTYTVTVTETPTCTAVASYTVTEPLAMDAACSKTDATTIGGADGTASVIATGGTAPYTYLWSNGQTSASISGLTAGTYTVTVTDLNGCTANCMVTVQEPGCNLSVTATGTDVSCNAGTDGTAAATASGSLVPVTYLWSNGSTTASITGLTAGTYTVTVTETPTCTAVASYTVTEPAVLDAACSKTDVTTIGGAEGTASVIATGGTAPYTYLWSNGETTASITGLTAGTYTVTVTDLNGCTANCMVTVQEPSCNLSANATGTDVSCNGGNNGTATATATGNLVPVTYLWSNGSTTASITGLTAGTYTVTVTETPSCTAVASYTVTEPLAMDAACSKTDATTIGGAEGTASVIATGGTAPYTYLWSNGETTASITGLTAGTYTVTVTDLNGCTANCMVTVQEPGCNLSATATGTNVLCNGGNNGTATATATGNLVPVTYLWSNGETTTSITGLTAGTYTVTVTETPTCTAVASYTVTEPAVLDAACSKTDVTTIGGAEGTASVIATGGTAPYTYLWSNGETTASITGLTAGTYTVTVTDLNGCTANCMVTVQEPSCNLSATATGTNVLCNGGNNGTATATATGNLVPVTYLWSNGETTTSITGLTAGTYTVTVTETPTCTAVASYTVTEPAVLDAACSKTDVTTIGGAEGTASVIATGGTAPYTYLWSNGETTASITGLTAGTYTVTVTDLNGCTANCMVTVQEPGCNLSATATGTNVLCNGGNNGTATATATGNLVPVTYLWSNGETTTSITGLTAGTYTVTVTETPSCTAVASYTVTEPLAMDAACSKTDATTIGGNQGTASVIATGGTAPYTYLWSNGQTSASITGLTAGTYTVTVTDLNGCTANCMVTVQEPSCNLSANATGTDVSCNGGNNGTATATATGNLVPVTYLWSNGATTASISSLTAGTYSVTITETPTCTAVASYTVTEPSAALDATCSKTDVTTNGGADGTASVSASGGTSPYTYLWNTGATTASISGLVAGTYSVTVTDANGCTDECTTTVQEPAPCAISVVSALPSNCDPATNTYSLTVTVTYSGQPAGNILVSTSTGESLSVAQTSSPQVIMLTGLAANGMTGIDVTATFVGDNACTHTLADAYDAPVDCAACPPAQCIPVTITKTNP